MEKLINDLRSQVQHLTYLLKVKESYINTLKMQNLDLYLKVEKFKRKKKLKL